MLVFEGPQGIGKSRAVKILGGDWFSDDMVDMGTKDAALGLRSVWIKEVSELGAMRRPLVESTKAFISRSTDHFRPPYGRRMIEQPRQSVFVGTTNADGYLRDESGGRRFWPVAVTSIDCDMLERDRDQLFAEAVQLFRGDQKWWLTERRHLSEAAEAQADRYDGDPWTDTVESYVSAKQDVSITEILQLGLGVGKERWAQIEQTRVARILRYSGWKRYQFRKGQARQWRYRRESSQEQMAREAQDDLPSRGCVTTAEYSGDLPVTKKPQCCPACTHCHHCHHYLCNSVCRYRRN